MLKVEGLVSKNLILDYSKGIEQFYIIGLFSSGIYLKDKKGKIIMIHDNKYGLIPFGIGINNFKETIKQSKINEGSLGILNDNILNIADAKIYLNIKELPSFTSNYLSDETFVKIATKQLFNTNKGVFKSLIDDSLEDNIYSKRLKKVLADYKDSEERLKEIVGLGPGLTPSGDDFIFGYLYWLINVNKAVDFKYINKIKNILLPFINKNTNQISKTYYDALLKEEKFELYERVCFSKNEEELIRNINDLFTVGSNSGVDILCGMIYANKHLYL